MSLEVLRYDSLLATEISLSFNGFYTGFDGISTLAKEITLNSIGLRNFSLESIIELEDVNV